MGVGSEGGVHENHTKPHDRRADLQVIQLLKIGQQPVQFTLGGRYYAEKPEGGPDWGLRFVVTFLFPK